MPSKYAQLNDKEWLEEKYLDERLCPRQIAEIIGCSAWSVRNALKRLGVPLRTQSQSEAAKGIKRKSVFAELLDKEWLEKKYLEERLSAAKIAKIVGCSSSLVYKALKFFHIPIRSISEVVKGDKNPNYGNHLSEEAKQRIGEANSNPSEETRQKLREARKHQKFPKQHTKPEMIWQEIAIDKHSLSFKYTGDGSFWIGGKPAINPDFIHLTKKIVVEIFSWHHNELLRHCKVRYSQTYEGRKKILKKRGWKMIVFWQDDLEQEDAEKHILRVLKKEKAI